jgi:polyhydroxyalkanoate synthesis regulator phasin
MQRSLKRKVVAGGIAALAVAGAGGALAATQWSPKAESDAVLEDAAKQLGVAPEELDDALRQALENRIDEAVKAGLMTEEEGNRLKQAIESGDFPVLGAPFFRGHGPGFGHGFGHPMHMELHGLETAAAYLGLSEDELKTQLEDGKSLADVAQAQEKSVDGLVDALVEQANGRIDEAVEDGHLTEEQGDELKAKTRERVQAFVNGELPTFERRFHGPPGFRFGPPGEPGTQEQDGNGDGASLSVPSV